MTEHEGRRMPRDDSYVWAPLSAVINVLAVFLVLPILVLIVIWPVTVFGGGSVSFGDDIEGKVCATASDLPVHRDAIAGVGRPESGVGIYPKSALVCEDRTSLDNPVGIFTLEILTELPTGLVYVVSSSAFVE